MLEIKNSRLLIDFTHFLPSIKCELLVSLNKKIKKTGKRTVKSFCNKKKMINATKNNVKLINVHTLTFVRQELNVPCQRGTVCAPSSAIVHHCDFDDHHNLVSMIYMLITCTNGSASNWYMYQFLFFFKLKIYLCRQNLECSDEE